MLTYEEFKTKLVERLKAERPEYLKECTPEESTELKNGTPTEYILFRANEKSQGVAAYPALQARELYRVYTEDFVSTGSSGTMGGENFEEFFRFTLCILKDSNVTCRNLSDIFNDIKSNIISIAVNADKEKRLLKNAPHTIIGDIAVIYMLPVGVIAPGCGGYTQITNDFMKQFELTEDDVKNAANQNAACQMIRTPGEMFCVTSPDYSYGAGVLFGSSDVRTRIYAELGENFYIIPASIHECMIMKESVVETFGTDYIKNIHKSICNEKDIIDETLFLSNEIYYYDGMHDRIMVKR